MTQVIQRFAYSLHRQQLKLREVDGQGPYPWAILRSGFYMWRKLPSQARVTAGTAHFYRLMLFDFQPQFGQFVDLPPFFDLPCDVLQIVLAVLAGERTMLDNAIRRLSLNQRLALMTFLATWTLLAFLAFSPGFAAQPIARRGLTAVVAIFASSSLQFFNTQQRCHQEGL